MPVIKQEDLVKLHEELEQITQKEEKLRKGYIELKLQSDKIKQHRLYRNIIIIILLITTSYFCYESYFAKSDILPVDVVENEKLIKTIDSLQQIIANQQVFPKKLDNATQVVFSVQLGVLNERDYNFDILNQQLTRTKVSNGVYSYRVGAFPDYKNAAVLKAKIRKMGIRGAFIVPYYQGKRIDIKKAIRLAK